MNNLPQIQEQQQPTVIEYVPSVAVTLEQMASNLQKLDQILRKVMKKGIDYDVIPGTPKPTLLKPGAERLLQAFGLGHRMECVDQKEDWENGFFYYRFKCTIVKTYPDYEIVVAECEGSANSKESRYKNHDVYSLVNTLQKMAQKRALVGAALQATGTSGRFTQDVEDMTESIPAKQQTYQQQPEPQPQQNGNGNGRKLQGMSTKAQQNKIFALAQERELGEKLLKMLIECQTGKGSVKELTKQEASDLISLMQQKNGADLINLIGEKIYAEDTNQLLPAEVEEILE